MHTGLDDLKFYIPLRAVKRLLGVMIVISLVSLVITIINDYLINPSEIVKQMVALFSIHGEGNIPTWIHATLLFLGILLGFANYLSERNRSDADKIITYGWLFLSFLFIYISADETGQIHERFGDIYYQLTNTKILKLPSGYFLKLYAPFIITATLGIFIFLKKILHVDRRSACFGFGGLALWVHSIVWEKIDRIYKGMDSFKMELRWIIRYITEYSEYFGTVVFLLFMLHRIKHSYTKESAIKID